MKGLLFNPILFFSENSKNEVDFKLKDLFFNPDLFFSEKSKNEVNFKYPLLIMLVNSIIAIGSFILLINNLKEIFFSDNILLLIPAVVWAIGAGLFITFAIWIVTAGIIYLISSLFNSNGSFMKTLEFVGYGFVPKIFSSLVGFFASYISFSLDYTSLNPQLATDNLRNTSIVPQITTILCLLLAAYIWIFALSNARNISVKKAILVVGIPVGLYLIYMICILLILTNLFT